MRGKSPEMDSVAHPKFISLKNIETRSKQSPFNDYKVVHERMARESQPRTFSIHKNEHYRSSMGTIEKMGSPLYSDHVSRYSSSSIAKQQGQKSDRGQQIVQGTTPQRAVIRTIHHSSNEFANTTNSNQYLFENEKRSGNRKIKTLNSNSNSQRSVLQHESSSTLLSNSSSKKKLTIISPISMSTQKALAGRATTNGIGDNFFSVQRGDIVGSVDRGLFICKNNNSKSSSNSNLNLDGEQYYDADTNLPTGRNLSDEYSTTSFSKGLGSLNSHDNNSRKKQITMHDLSGKSINLKNSIISDSPSAVGSSLASLNSSSKVKQAKFIKSVKPPDELQRSKRPQFFRIVQTLSQSNEGTSMNEKLESVKLHFYNMLSSKVEEFQSQLGRQAEHIAELEKNLYSNSQQLESARDKLKDKGQVNSLQQHGVKPVAHKPASIFIHQSDNKRYSYIVKRVSDLQAELKIIGKHIIKPSRQKQQSQTDSSTTYHPRSPLIEEKLEIVTTYLINNLHSKMNRQKAALEQFMHEKSSLVDRLKNDICFLDNKLVGRSQLLKETLVGMRLDIERLEAGKEGHDTRTKDTITIKNGDGDGDGDGNGKGMGMGMGMDMGDGGEGLGGGREEARQGAGGKSKNDIHIYQQQLFEQQKQSQYLKVRHSGRQASDKDTKQTQEIKESMENEDEFSSQKQEIQTECEGNGLKPTAGQQYYNNKLKQVLREKKGLQIGTKSTDYHCNKKKKGHKDNFPPLQQKPILVGGSNGPNKPLYYQGMESLSKLFPSENSLFNYSLTQDMNQQQQQSQKQQITGQSPIRQQSQTQQIQLKQMDRKGVGQSTRSNRSHQNRGKDLHSSPQNISQNQEESTSFILEEGSEFKGGSGSHYHNEKTSSFMTTNQRNRIDDASCLTDEFFYPQGNSERIGDSKEATFSRLLNPNAGTPQSEKSVDVDMMRVEKEDGKDECRNAKTHADTKSPSLYQEKQKGNYTRYSSPSELNNRNSHSSINSHCDNRSNQTSPSPYNFAKKQTIKHDVSQQQQSYFNQCNTSEKTEQQPEHPLFYSSSSCHQEEHNLIRHEEHKQSELTEKGNCSSLESRNTKEGKLVVDMKEIAPIVVKIDSQTINRKIETLSRLISEKEKNFPELRNKSKLPLRCFVDKNGYLKYTDSKTLVFDEKGNLIPCTEGEFWFLATKGLLEGKEQPRNTTSNVSVSFTDD